MKNKRKIGVIALIGVVSLMIATPFLRNYYIKSLVRKNSVSIGIIGGADGPTAIFLAGQSPVLYIAKFLGAALVTTILIVFYRKVSKRRKNS
ncbi:hypothetical protein QE109_01450 [Fusibacter bizertensis]|jgi:subunit.|uniref:Sodium ion-translocating decarboxylase subunit beta n=1 Tax=Fusibacter bizertensis TaxID=1488331 RepID=A0ABT6N8R0_9FIRM|nr:hypothetical protein [Fusibacter bizertensis]MDH8676788.1 hypothetical protein [Fusibacter bizertensis]